MPNAKKLSKKAIASVIAALVVIVAAVSAYFYTRPETFEVSLLLAKGIWSDDGFSHDERQIPAEYEITLRRNLFGKVEASGTLSFDGNTYTIEDVSFSDDNSYSGDLFSIRFDFTDGDSTVPLYINPDITDFVLFLRDYRSDYYSEITSDSFCFELLKINDDNENQNYFPAIDYYIYHPDEYYRILRFIADVFDY